jgi:hypothetical protein
MAWEFTKLLSPFLTVISWLLSLLKLTRHEILFQPKETYHHVRITNRHGEPQSIWLHLMVKNKGYVISRDAEASLTEIWKIKEGFSIKKLDEFKAPVKLKWAHEKYIQPIDILPNKSRRLDVCYIYENGKLMHLEAESFPSGTIKNELPPDNYVFLISVISKNCLRPAKFYFNVSWDGRWGTLKGKDYNSIFKDYKKC